MCLSTDSIITPADMICTGYGDTDCQTPCDGITPALKRRHFNRIYLVYDTPCFGRRILSSTTQQTGGGVSTYKHDTVPAVYYHMSSFHAHQYIAPSKGSCIRRPPIICNMVGRRSRHAYIPPTYPEAPPCLARGPGNIQVRDVVSYGTYQVL